MAQSFLRFREIRRQLDYDLVLLMFAPEVDLWRDINTIRDLAEPWEFPLVVPRFAIEDDELRLIRGPYRDPNDVYAANAGGLSPTLRAHLRKYDRFYFRPKYENSSPLLDWSILYKLTARLRYLTADQRLRDHLMDPRSEAVRVSKRIFAAMAQEIRRDGKAFVLVLLPVADHWWDGGQVEPDFSAWRRMAASICSDDLRCIDLSDDLRRVPPAEIDRGYDGSHFGPRINRLIAERIWQRLPEAGAARGFHSGISGG